MHIDHRGLIDHHHTGCVNNDDARCLNNCYDPGDDDSTYNNKHEHGAPHNVFKHHDHSDNHIAAER